MDGLTNATATIAATPAAVAAPPSAAAKTFEALCEIVGDPYCELLSQKMRIRILQTLDAFLLGGNRSETMLRLTELMHARKLSAQRLWRCTSPSLDQIEQVWSPIANCVLEKIVHTAGLFARGTPQLLDHPAVNRPACMRAFAWLTPPPLRPSSPPKKRQRLEATLPPPPAPPPAPPPNIELPHFINKEGAPRPVPEGAQSAEQALRWIAGKVKAGAPGGLIEAEAFALIYNLSVQVWVPGERPADLCSLQQVLGQLDPNEHYVSGPLNLVALGGNWSVCDSQGKPELLQHQYKGPDGLYRALQIAVQQDCLMPSASLVPANLRQIRQDVAACLQGAPAYCSIAEAERTLAVRWLRSLQLPHGVMTTRRTAAGGVDYLAPLPDFMSFPILGLVHRGQRGWHVFLSKTRQTVCADRIEGALLYPSRKKHPGTLEGALGDLMSLLGRPNDPQMASLRQPKASTEALPRALSEAYAKRAMDRLKQDYSIAKSSFSSNEQRTIV